MQKHKTCAECHHACKEQGFFIPIEPNKDRIHAMLSLCKSGCDAVNHLTDHPEIDPSIMFTLAYDALHLAAEAFLMKKGWKSTNHKCLFAFICNNHPEFELNWNFFEKMRTKRNGMHYYGTLITKESWKEIELEWKLAINALSKIIE